MNDDLPGLEPGTANHCASPLAWFGLPCVDLGWFGFASLGAFLHFISLQFTSIHVTSLHFIKIYVTLSNSV